MACKEWNQLPDDGLLFTGMSYDNTGEPGASTWRYVSFIERPVPLGGQETGLGAFSWLLISDVCKHCRRAGCLEACPTGAIIRTEFDSVYVQPDVCNGLRLLRGGVTVHICWGSCLALNLLGKSAPRALRIEEAPALWLRNLPPELLGGIDPQLDRLLTVRQGSVGRIAVS